MQESVKQLLARVRDYDKHTSDDDIDRLCDEIERLNKRVSDLLGECGHLQADCAEQRAEIERLQLALHRRDYTPCVHCEENWRLKLERDETRTLLTQLYDAARDANIWLFQAPPHDHDGRAKVASQLNRTLIEVNNEIDDSLKALQQYLRRQEDAKKAEGGE